MSNKAIRTSDGAREIIEYNIYILYHLPKRYSNLEKALKNVRYDLLKILNFCKDKEPIIWKQKYVWFVDNKRLTEVVRERKTKATSNRHFNYLCCIGAIEKLEQYENHRTGVNMTFLANQENGSKKRDINTFTVYRYTQQKLEYMEQRAAMLLESKVTAENISNDKLKACGLTGMAEEVFYANSEKSIKNKMRSFEMIMEQVAKLCDEKGYTDKGEVCSCIGWSRDRLDYMLNIFRHEWTEQYQYKAPNKFEVEKYRLESRKWIIIRRT